MAAGGIDPNLYASLAVRYSGGIRRPEGPENVGKFARVAEDLNLEYVDIVPTIDGLTSSDGLAAAIADYVTTAGLAAYTHLPGQAGFRAGDIGKLLCVTDTVPKRIVRITAIGPFAVEDVKTYEPRIARPVLVAADNSPIIAGGLAQIGTDGVLNLEASSSYQPANTVINLSQPRCVIRGAGKRQTKLRCNAALSTLFNAAANQLNVELRDMTIDCAGNVTNLLLANSTFVRSIKIDNCHLENLQNGVVNFQDAGPIEITNCTIEGHGKCKGILVSVSGSQSRVVMRHNHMRGIYCAAQFLGSNNGETLPDTQVQQLHDVTGNYFDGMWFTAPAKSASTGTGVYTTDVSGAELYDPTFDFTSVGADSTLRVLHARVNTTATFLNAQILVDSVTDFLAAGVVEGEFVEVAGVRAVVLGVEQHALTLESWVDQSTGLEVTFPGYGAGVAYKVWGVYLMTGIAVLDAHHMRGLWNWFDLAGNVVTPNTAGVLQDGDRWELLPQGSNFLNFDGGTRGALVYGNTVVRTVNDSITFTSGAHDTTISNNNIWWGRDTGISTNAETYRLKVLCNNFYRMTQQAWIIQGTDCEIAHNTMHNGSWLPRGPLTNCAISHLQRGQCHHNSFSNSGLAISEQSPFLVWGSIGTKYADNAIKDLAAGVAEYHIVDDSVAGCEIVHTALGTNPIDYTNIGYSHADGTEGSPTIAPAQLTKINLTSDPGGAIDGGLGSWAINSSNGKFWLKTASGTGGWHYMNVT